MFKLLQLFTIAAASSTENSASESAKVIAKLNRVYENISPIAINGDKTIIYS